MGKIYEGFRTGGAGLIVSLPGNDPELATAAQAGGADMIKVHLNVTHAASGIHFGPLSEEKSAIEKILSSVDIPVGIMPGAAEQAPIEDMIELEKMGIAFFDIYLSDMPASYLELETMEPMAALGPGWSNDDVESVGDMGISMLEASIVEHGNYGNPLDGSDLQAYGVIANRFGGAVIVPTQKKIRPDEVQLLRRAGVSGIMIGKIVTGDSPSGIEAATAEFSAAIRDSRPQ